MSQADQLPFQGYVKFVPTFQPSWNLGIANWNLGIWAKTKFQLGIPVFVSYVKLFQFGTANWNFAKSLIYKANFVYNLWISCGYSKIPVFKKDKAGWANDLWTLDCVSKCNITQYMVFHSFSHFARRPCKTLESWNFGINIIFFFFYYYYYSTLYSHFITLVLLFQIPIALNLFQKPVPITPQKV